MDAFGTVTSSEEEFEDYESGEQTAETEDLGNGDFDAQVSKAPESDESVGARHSNNDNKDREKAEESGSSWIGSAVQGWFANNVKEEADGLNVQGFGEGNAEPSETRKLSQGKNMQEAASPKGEDPAERMGEHERSVDQRDEGWYDSVYNRITHFYQDRNEAIGKDEGIENKDGDKVPIFEGDPASLLIQEDSGQSEGTTAERDERQEVTSQGNREESARLGAGWYGSIYNRISGFYGDAADGKGAPDKSDDVKNIKEDPPVTSEPTGTVENADHTAKEPRESHNLSVFSTSGLMSVIDSLRSPSIGAGSDDDTRRSESVMPEPSVTPSHVSAHQSDAVTLNRDDAEGSGTTENGKFLFSLSRFSKIINGLTSPLENRNAGDAEESDAEEASGKKDNDVKGNNDDELSVRETHVISEISARISEEEEEQDGKGEKEEKIEEKKKEVEKGGEEGEGEEVKQDGGGGGKEEGEAEEGEEQKDEKVGEREEQQEGGEEEKEEQDGGGKEEGEEREEQEEETEEVDEARHEVNVAETQINSVKRSLDFNKQDVSDGGKNISTDIRTSSDNVHVDVDKFDDHSDSSLTHSDEVNKSLPEEEETQHESESSSDSGLQVRINVLQTSFKTGDKSDGAQDEGEAANILLETEETGMKVSSSQVVETVWMVSDDEKNCADVTQECGGEGEGGDDVEKEHCGSDLSLVTQTESSGDKEATEDTRMETDGEKETLNITQKSGGETECGETPMECSGGKDDGDVSQTESGGEEESVDLIQKDQLSLHTAHGLENTHNISDTKQKLELHHDGSRESEKHQGAAVKQIETRPNNIQDKSPSADGSKSKASSTSDGNPEIQRLREKHGDEMTEVKHHEVRRSAQTQKQATPDSQAHLSEEDIKELLKFLDTETLLRLDFIAAHLEDVSSEEVAELHDFQQTLEHLLQKNRNPETNKPSLQSIQTVLTMLKEKLIPVIADASVDKRPGTNDMYIYFTFILFLLVHQYEKRSLQNPPGTFFFTLI